MTESLSASLPIATSPPLKLERRYRVLAVASHPVQYMSPILRRMAHDPRFDLQVAYCSLRGAEAAVDPEFGATVQWDVPLLEGYAWTHVPNRGSGAESFWGLRNPGLGKVIREGKFDAVLCYVSYRRASFWIAYQAAKASGTAFLFGTDAISLAPREHANWKVVVKRWSWPRLFRLADQVIVPSTGTKEFVRTLGIPPERITLTPYTVDNDWWRQHAERADRAAIREKWGFSPDELVILFCAKLQPWKGPLDLMNAFAEANLGRAVLVFAGEGPLRSELERAAEGLGIEKRVRFLGFVNQSQLPGVYTSADVLALPSLYEPFAVVVNEAMCCGCPVIASDHVGAVRDLVAPVAPECVFPAGNVAALAETLRRVLGDRDKLKGIRQAMLAHIQTWSPERNIAATFDAVESAVKRVRNSHEN